MDGIRVRSMNEAYKSANSSLKTKIRSFNPTKEPAPGAQRATKIKFKKWINWLKKDQEADYMDRLKGLDTEYKRRLSDMKSQFHHYLRTNNLRDLHSEFDWL